MTRCLVTGVAGFIGSHLARELVDRGHDVRGLDNLSTGRYGRIEALAGNDSFEFVRGDLREIADVREAVADVEWVFHQAAVPSVPRSVENPRLTTSANCLGSTNLLVAARDADVDACVVASSSSVYGSGGDLPRRESQPVNPESPYALSKYWTERLACQCYDLYGLDTAALRYFNVFGPGQDPSGEYAAVVPTFVDRMLAGERPIVFGDGDQSRDFTYVDNVVQANLLAIEGQPTGDVFNVGCGERFTVNRLVDELNDILGTDLEPRHDEPRPGDVRHSHASIASAADAIGYEPTVGFREGLERTVEAARS